MAFVRDRGAFELIADRDTLRVRRTARAEPDAAVRCLAALAAGHRAVEARSPCAPAVRFVGDDEVVLACAPVLDLEGLVARLAAARRRVSFALILELVERAVGHLAAVRDVEHTAVGAFAWSNVWLSVDGELWLAGIGYNVCVFDERGAESGAPGAVVAPEVSAGSLATASADLYATSRSLLVGLLPFVEVPVELQRVFTGTAAPGSPLAALTAWAGSALWSPIASQRTTDPGELLGRLAELRVALGVDDRDPLRTLVAELGGEADPPHALIIADDGSWFRAPYARRVDVGRRRALREILVAFVAARAAGRRLAAAELVAAAWPGESLLPDVAQNRMHVALATLRRLGLRRFVTFTDAGYGFADDVDVVTVSAT